ncbi:MAG: PQQ-binding-like beta-propeller repeat protein [Acidobacteria bacterium]|nr:PQQ-binding-like beta-propeller repeat protein [Acidobacteriota bacterium]
MRNFICRAGVACALLALPLAAADWPQFRGPNASGVGTAHHLPVEFGPAKNVVWKTDLPPGHSSPVVSGDRIFLTAADSEKLSDAGREKVADTGEGKLLTFCLDRRTGKILWRREAPRARREAYQPTNSAASPSPVTDGRNVYVFFGDYGLLSYGPDGNERWRVPLGPFNNVNGHGSSPILVGNLLVLICDQDTDSFIIALDKDTGKTRWRVERPEITRSYVTPAIFQPKNGPAELIVPGAYELISYAVETGEKLWWVRGLSWQPKSVPVIDGDMIYAHSWEQGGEAENPTETPTWTETLARYDSNHDGKISPEEITDPRLKRGLENIDLDGNGTIEERDWEFYRARRSARNALLAVRHGGRGDLTSTNVVWRMQKFLPNVPSPLLYQGVLYIVKDGGILTSLDPATGAILKQGRLRGAPGTYYSSPVAADGKIYSISQEGKASVLKPGAQWEVLAVNDLKDECYATPALVDDRIYLRTRSRLYCFGQAETAR